MFKGKSILAIIPARGGSKGIPRKNIIPVAGKPLIAWTIEEAKKSSHIDRLILSSDNPEIISVARKLGCEVPFRRPAALSTDSSPSIDAVLHALRKVGTGYDYIILLQTTSPIRSCEDIDGAIEKCISLNADSCVSVVEPKKSPFWTYKTDLKGRLVPLIKRGLVKRRQDLPQTYCLNGAIYVAKVEWLLKSKSLIGRNTVPYVMGEINSIDIDSRFELDITDFIIRKMQRESGVWKKHHAK
ncbi:MAG TPA: acylneuraminate cytidylyltransferase [Lentisphaeria bacterium]|nr:MAG: acylneuraminate cytidylyltransferase [Lentisphaerae bacterium GWF2_50_93]HCE45631.1 acylneuraminate cytidylyltransferase [Lentisphaeria bacterium]